MKLLSPASEVEGGEVGETGGTNGTLSLFFVDLFTSFLFLLDILD